MKQRIAAAVLTAALTIAAGVVSRWEPAPGGARYIAYQDVGGVWTICDGRTRGVKPGDTATPEQCDAWRDEDLREAASHVSRCITHPLTPNQLGAFTSAAYNIGPAVVCGSTLQRKANVGDIRGACAELGRWVHAAGKRLRGLVLRRAHEMAICWPDFGNVIAGVSR